MADGQVAAALSGLAGDTAQAIEDVGGKFATVLDEGANIEDANLARVEDAEAKTTQAVAGAGRQAGQEPVGSPGAGGLPTKTDRLKEHLTARDLEAARRELNGEVVARKADGTPWDHVDEVRNAQRGLVNRIAAIKRQLGDSRVSAAARAALNRELSEASRLLDNSEQYVPRR